MVSTMRTGTLTNQASDRAHEVVDQLGSSLADAEETVKTAANQATEQAELLAMEAQIKATEALDSLQVFVKEKPLQAAGIAFAAGIVTAMLLRRK